MFKRFTHADCVREPPPAYDSLQKLHPTKFDEEITFKDEGHLYFRNGEQMNCLSVSRIAKKFHPKGESGGMNLDVIAHKSVGMLQRKSREWFSAIWTLTHNYADAFTLYEEQEFEPNFLTRKQFFGGRLLVQLEEIEQYEQRIVRGGHRTLDEALGEVQGFIDGFNAGSIRKNWCKASELGTLLHEFIEARLNGVHLPIPHNSVLGNLEYLQVQRFFERYPTEPWRTELRVFSEYYNVVGSVDYVEVSRRDALGNVVAVCVGDWKRTHKIKERHEDDFDYRKKTEERYLPPINHLIPCVRNEYNLQISIYAFIIEQELGLLIDGVWLGVAFSDNREMLKVNLPYLREEAHSVLEHLKNN